MKTTLMILAATCFSINIFAHDANNRDNLTCFLMMNEGAKAGVVCNSEVKICNDINAEIDNNSSNNSTDSDLLLQKLSSAVDNYKECIGKAVAICASVKDKISSEKSLEKEWEETKNAIKAKNEYYKRLHEHGQTNRFDESFKSLGL